MNFAARTPEWELARLRNWLETTPPSHDGRLPPERRLCETLGLSRGALRKALTILEDEGLLTRHVGRGTFLTNPPSRATAVPRDTATAHHIAAEYASPSDLLVARLAVEPELAGHAAIHASLNEVRTLEELADAIKDAETWESFHRIEAAFHAEVALAARAPLLAGFHANLNAIQIALAWSPKVQDDEPPAENHPTCEALEKIARAIASRNRAGARKASRHLLEYSLAQLVT